MTEYAKPVNRYLKSIDIQPYDRYLPNAFNDSLTLLEKVNKVVYQLNESNQLTNDMVKEWNDFAEWMNTDGIDKPIIEKMDELISNGTFSSLIKPEIDKFEGEINQKIEKMNTTLSNTQSDHFSNSPFLEIPEQYLTIPSTLGNALTTHPSVIDFGETKKWNGYRYWMAHTPYPGTQNENPSIAASNDNKTWVLPKDAPNPLVPPPPAPSYYSDTEMHYIPETDKLRIYYRKAIVSETEGIGTSAEFHYIESSNGSIWSEPIVCLVASSGMHLSPAIVRISSTDWRMWYVESQTKFGYRTSIDGLNWSAETLINQPWTNWSVWHIGVVRDNKGKFHMLGSTYPNTGTGEGTQYRPIIYANSEDGLSWVGNEKPQLIPTGWAGGYLYRPSFMVNESKGLKENLPYVRLWFSASDDGTAAGWHIGYTEGYIIPGNDNASATSEKMKRKRVGEYFKIFASNIVSPFAKISRIKTKRIEVTSDYSQPLIEYRDGRPGKNNGNYMREEYIGSNDKTQIRQRMTIRDDNGNTYTITISPFDDDTNSSLSFTRPTTLNNILQLVANEVIANSNLQLRNGTKVNRILTSSGGNLVVQLTGGGSNYIWTYRGDGQLDAGNQGTYNQSYLGLSPQTVRPSHLGASRPGIYLADGITHNPTNDTGGKPYLVYWDGIGYTKLN